ncbi:MAG: AzlC family ABC transporter permease [Nocardioides sp.]|uniref:AzlC family ABC transporter permease n=1 Tax=Nocardioides sp. TaxID=35761 RepID=UPI0039E62398
MEDTEGRGGTEGTESWGGTEGTESWGGVEDEDGRGSFRRGFRAGIPFAVAGGLLSVSFGVVARDSGFTALAAVLTSLLVFAGAAQFAAIAVVAAGGTPVAAAAAAGLMNSRFLPMGVALAPSLRAGAVVRAFQGQAIVDASWAMADRGDGTFDRWFLFGATAPQWVTWQAGTIIGAYGGSLLGALSRFGLDAVYPAFFLAVLVPELRDRNRIGVALGGVLIALAVTPFVPGGLPVLLASLAALWGLRGSRA